MDRFKDNFLQCLNQVLGCLDLSCHLFKKFLQTFCREFFFIVCHKKISIQNLSKKWNKNVRLTQILESERSNY